MPTRDQIKWKTNSSEELDIRNNLPKNQNPMHPCCECIRKIEKICYRKTLYQHIFRNAKLFCVTRKRNFTTCSKLREKTTYILKICSL